MVLRRFDFRSVAGGRSVGAVVLCATLLLTACGGSDKKSTPTPTKSAATVVAPTTAAGSTSGNTTPSAAATTASGSTSGNTTPTAEPTFDAASFESTANAQATTFASFTGSIDACKLVSRKDAEKIIGKKLSGDPFHGGPGMPNAKFVCNYNPESVPGTAVVEGQTVMLIALTKDDLKAFDPTQDDVEKAFSEGKESAKEDEGYTDVDGVGDDAYYTTDTGLSARKGDKAVSVMGLPLDKAKDFAKKAIDNL
jgi:hypothetical protein